MASAAPSESKFAANVIIIGAGVFGLSTALAIANRHPSTSVTVVDRCTPPVPDGSSVDTTRCIRWDYPDPIYAQLAKQSQLLIEQDPELSKHFFKRGMTFVCNGVPSRFTQGWQDQYNLTKDLAQPEHLVDLPTRETLFQRIHGKDAKPLNRIVLGREPQWNVAYTNKEDAFIDAEAGIQVYYDRCLQYPSIRFRCGTEVDHINIDKGIAKGVVLADGSNLQSDMVIVAAGAWSSRLVSLGSRVYPIGHEVVWFKVTREEEMRWKAMSITTNDSTGLNIFPPYRGEVKVLRRSPGVKNSITIPKPENRSETMEISYPRTLVTNPTDIIPANAEAAIREDLREIMPSLASRPFDRTKICWISTTPTADFLIAPHPSVGGIHLATGGSAHAWKFVPVLGDLVVDSIMGNLSKELEDKWAFDKSGQSSDQAAPRMDGAPEELRDVVRTIQSHF
ncbi:putative fructosyl amino acid oxidasesarcosine oxidase [Aaosphaeria arxii CBS 175.79]|uniref:Putative fructosyl amino acid oxidasesarcosine oxidase n=1 Tax=Aaosphaeria arxii CBS 175.79 TaxID=1450172 RepID=A0A6A5X6P1_9PLEO|nr:putative fructosyl amino acid oxidasesarcosine oxidase [Aaosphaeria arxii CBS 175.79]KAF2008546.1 putative fructosyl amino acid oxidasesarcosine oxidase [Aaosphaeria arxii CBS 175.79]